MAVLSRSRQPRGDGFQEYPAMTDEADAQILQVLRRQTRQDLPVDRIVAECHLVLFEAQAPQPTVNVQV